MELSVVIPVSERVDNVEKLFNDYRSALASLEKDCEFIYILDGAFPEVAASLQELQEQGHPIEIIQLSKSFGEATALTAGFDSAKSDNILTLPSYYQIESSEIPKILAELESTDLVVGARVISGGLSIKSVQRRAFNWLVSWLSGAKYSDLGCGARAIRREVTDELRIYGDQHRFLPLLAARSGFRVREVPVQPSSVDASKKYHGVGVYLRRLLDVLTVFFLVKFTKKPLRFFGLIGSAIAVFGAVCVVYVVAERLFGSVALADRPALLIGALFVVLGVQLFAIGLIGELIIFVHSRNDKEYRVEQLINMDVGQSELE